MTDNEFMQKQISESKRQNRILEDSLAKVTDELAKYKRDKNSA